ncbi:MAG TPA: hypothetical protein VHQ24_14950 [Lachnospiraceae bacterium]|nr:hypothetical protein [Lachnospiraceae bacterium]HEX3078157.1 hypothetical protein [Lachnospiraceae bacterium]
MNEIFIEYMDTLDSTNYKILINFLISICDKMSYSIHINNYQFIQDEYEIALKHLSYEFNEEDRQRRIQYKENLKYRDSLLNLYHTDKEVLAFLDRQKYYDAVELNEIVNLLQSYKGKKFKRLFQDINLRNRGRLPEESYDGCKYTSKSHCSIGEGLFKVYSFIIDKSIVNYLYEIDDLTKFNEFRDNEWLEDPAFYHDVNLKCSICSHERTFALFLNDDEFEKYKLLKIPYSF